MGVKWLLEYFCPTSDFVTADSDEARNPQRFYMYPLKPYYKYN